jgi:hypothetical protein
MTKPNGTIITRNNTSITIGLTTLLSSVANLNHTMLSGLSKKGASRLDAKSNAARIIAGTMTLRLWRQ